MLRNVQKSSYNLILSKNNRDMEGLKWFSAYFFWGFCIHWYQMVTGKTDSLSDKIPAK